ncbi:hypothetical protein CLOM_g24576 [Closterium sp. NIES-68]|nr:hypothetical protein CLOM_g24576 [Closterium sp. NIES-68]
MGHAGKQQLLECVKKGELKGVEVKEGAGQQRKCPDCTSGKLPRTSFPISSDHASTPLELVHMDQNGAAERLNRTLTDLARAILAHAELDNTWLGCYGV